MTTIKTNISEENHLIDTYSNPGLWIGCILFYFYMN